MLFLPLLDLVLFLLHLVQLRELQKKSQLREPSSGAPVVLLVGSGQRPTCW